MDGGARVGRCARAELAQEVSALADTFAAGGKDFFKTSIFAIDKDVSLSWRLTADEQEAIRRQMQRDNPRNLQQLEQLHAWWNSRCEHGASGCSH